MKRGILVLLVVIVIGGLLAGGWWWARTSPEQVIQVLADGGLERTRAEEFVALVGGQVETQEEDILVASGSIEGETVAVVSEYGGQITGLYADESDEVAAGEVVVELDASLLLAQRAQAEAAVVAAQANLANVQAGTHPAEIVAAEAVLRKTLAERDAAETAWKNTQVILGNPQEIDAQVVEAQNEVNLAASQIEQYEAKLASATFERDRYKAQGSFEEKELFASYNYQVEAAQAALDGARAN
jgi:multidrug efflux pump subunit AcrA (membrane-fusion protein)